MRAPIDALVIGAVQAGLIADDPRARAVAAELLGRSQHARVQVVDALLSPPGQPTAYPAAFATSRTPRRRGAVTSEVAGGSPAPRTTVPPSRPAPAPVAPTRAAAAPTAYPSFWQSAVAAGRPSGVRAGTSARISSEAGVDIGAWRRAIALSGGAESPTQVGVLASGPAPSTLPAVAPNRTAIAYAAVQRAELERMRATQARSLGFDSGQVDASASATDQQARVTAELRRQQAERAARAARAGVRSA